jgi:hypothetical protein
MMETKSYRLKIVFAEPILGSQPQKDVATEYTQAKARQQGQDVADETDTLPEMMEKGTTAFHRVDGAPVLWDYQVKGFLKESANVQNGIHGVKNLRSKFGALVFVRPRMIPFLMPVGGDGQFLERPLRAMTAQGPRVAVARSEMLPAGTSLECRIVTLPGPITETILRQVLDYGQFAGLGQWRSGGWGSFTYTLTSGE